MNDSDRTRLERVVDALIAHHVSFVVIGGWAEVLHGSPRVTRDVDVCYRRKPEDMKNILAALRSLDAKLRVPGGTVPMPIDERMLASVEQLTLDSHGLPFRSARSGRATWRLRARSQERSAIRYQQPRRACNFSRRPDHRQTSHQSPERPRSSAVPRGDQATSRR